MSWIAVSLGFFGAAALRGGRRRDELSSIKFSVEAFTYEEGSWVECVARENLRVDLPDGHSRTVGVGEQLLPWRVYFKQDTEERYVKGWYQPYTWVYVRQTASFEIEISRDLRVDENRHVPHFDCGIHSPQRGLECQAPSNSFVDYYNADCVVEITDKSPVGKAKFSVAAWSSGPSKLQCIAVTDLHLDEDGADRLCRIGSPLFEERPLQIEVAEETYTKGIEDSVTWKTHAEVNLLNFEVDLLNFCPEYDGFVCKLINDDGTYDACEGTSWGAVGANGNTDCTVEITQEKFVPN